MRRRIGRRGRARPLPRKSDPQPSNARLPRLRAADRRSLLAGTALASTLLIATVAAPLPAMAVVGDCAAAGPQAVRISDVVPIICINTETRNEPGRPYAIYLDTTAPFASIFVNNFGMLTAAAPGDTTALLTSTLYADSPITIINNAKATATSL